VRRVLDNEYSNNESQASLSANVIMEREYSYDANDYSLFASKNDNITNLREKQTDDFTLRLTNVIDGSLTEVYLGLTI